MTDNQSNQGNDGDHQNGGNGDGGKNNDGNNRNDGGGNGGGYFSGGNRGNQGPRNQGSRNQGPPRNQGDQNYGNQSRGNPYQGNPNQGGSNRPNQGYGGQSGGRPNGGRPTGGRPRSGGGGYSSSGGYSGGQTGGRPNGGRPSGGRPSQGGGFSGPPRGGRPGGGGGFGGGRPDSRGAPRPGGFNRDDRDGPREVRVRYPKPDIVDKDNFVLLVNKPAGIPTRKGQSPTLVDMVEELSGARKRLMRVAHELDTNASGIVLFVAMRDSEDSPRTQTHPETSYLALVEGVFGEEAKVTGETITGPVAHSSGIGATPSTHIRVVESGNGLSLVRVRARPDLPEQIREHLAQAGHPIVGDHKHGAIRDDIQRLALHANGLRITHPEEDKTMRYKCSAPASFWLAMGAEPPADAAINSSNETDASVVKKGWDHVAGWYEGLIAHRGSDHHQQIILPGVMNLLDLQSDERVLDVACGQGVMSEYIATHSDVDQVLGTDISDALIDAANKRATDRTSFKVWDACELSKLEHEPCDAATCVMAMMNIEHIEQVFKGVYDRLKPGGRFVFVISHPAYRVMGGSAWGWTMDERNGQQVQFRRVDRYLSEKSKNIVMNPGEVANGKPAITTITHHRPISSYMNACASNGLLIDAVEEWASRRTSEPGPRAAAENFARREIPLFLAIRCRKPAND
ncbi:MAG: methyltransferase domain-containing protein [Phycisphaerales bacterium]|nr:methyltransferase domain-containing protein [Phycisphaerales bacterium]